MTVTDKAWQSYIKKLSAINRKAAKIMQDWISVNGLDYPEELISYAYGIVGKYGEAAGALACEMYDTLARAQGKTLPDAVPAEPATYSEVARAVIGTKKERPGQVPDTVARLVKQTAADTTLQNAKRDGAQFAWIPHGDTCSFCITLASRGWQYMSKNALKNGHAEHIHANCDCEYGVRFDGKSNVAGYDPDKYLEQYNNAEGTKPQDKINSMRREQYAKDADKINARRRERYAETHAKKTKIKDVTKEYYSKAQPGSGSFSVEEESYRKTHRNEVSIADLIHKEFGGDIVVRKERPGQENADFLWREKLWELKNPEKEKNLTKLIQKGLSQIFDNPGGIIVDRTLLDLKLEDVEKIITDRMNTSMKHQTYVVIIKDYKVEKVLRYKK